MMSRWDKYEYDELADTLSDYHKDVYGYRLRMYGEPRECLIEELNRLDKHIEDMKSTPEGRASLRADGWEIEEPTC